MKTIAVLIAGIIAMALLSAPVFGQENKNLPKEIMILDLKPGQVAIFNAKDLDKEGRAPVPVPGHPNILSVQKEKRWNDWARANAVYVQAQGGYEEQHVTAEAVKKGDYPGASLFKATTLGNTSAHVTVNFSAGVYGGVVTGLPVGMTAAQYNASGASNQVIDLGEALTRQLRGGN